MSYYHIKNINVDRKNNCISADLADSCWEPLDWFHINDLSDEPRFEEKYAEFIYNLVSGNFHTISNNKYSKIVMNPYLRNYYDDAHDIGVLNTYDKYREVIQGIMNNDYSKCIILKSDRELNPNRYYKLTPIETNISNYNFDYYTNEIGDLYCIKEGKLYYCDSTNKNYGYPYGMVWDMKCFINNNDFLKNSENISSNKQCADLEKEIEYELE